MQATKTLVTILGPNLDVALQVKWAVHLAAANKLDLLILNRVESTDDRLEEVLLDQSENEVSETESSIDTVVRIIKESDELRAGERQSSDTDEAEDSEIHNVYVRLKNVYFTSNSSLRRMTLTELGNKDVELFTQARAEVTDVSDTDLIKERRLFLRYIPCEVVLCLGLDEETEFSRILVATAPGRNGRAALQLGARLVSVVNGTLTALHVNPNVGTSAEEVGERRLESHITKSLGKDYPDIDSRVIVDDKIDDGIKRVWEKAAMI